jgi:hypothetical protein
MGFKKSEVGPNLYHIVVGADTLIIVLYVDDLFITRVERLIVGCMESLASYFEMKDMLIKVGCH